MKTCRVRIDVVMRGRNNRPVRYSVSPFPYSEELYKKYSRLVNRRIDASAFSEKLDVRYIVDLMISDAVYNASYETPISELESYSIVGFHAVGDVTDITYIEKNSVVSSASTASGSSAGGSTQIANSPNISQKHKMITFGYQVFEATSGKVYTPNGLEMEWGKETETQGIVGQKPISYVKSKSLIKANFRINSSRYLGSDPEAVKAAWSEMAENNMTYGFMIGNEYVGTRFIVKSVRMTNTRYNGSGKLISATFDISVEEYAGENYKLSVLQEPSEYS